MNRLIHYPALPVQVSEDRGHVGFVLPDCSHEQVLPCFSQLRSALSVLVVSMSLELMVSTALVLIVSTSLGAIL